MKLDSTRKKAAIPPSRWLAYATAGLATGAVTAPTADAEIHYFSPVHIHMEGPNAATWRVPLTGGASLTFYRDADSAPSQGNIFSDAIAVSRNAAVHAIRRGRGGPFYSAANLPAGSNVSGGLFYSGFPELIDPDFGQFTLPGVGYAGFKFDVGNGVQYGWVRLRTNQTRRPQAIMTVLDYAFADPGEPIAAGQRTENEDVMRPPAEESLGALALGAAGVCAWRRRRASREK
jgi:hypothetical protein